MFGAELYILNSNVFLYWHPLYEKRVLVNLDNSFIIECGKKSIDTWIAYFFSTPKSYLTLTESISDIHKIDIKRQFTFLIENGFLIPTNEDKVKAPKWNKQHPVDKLLLTVAGWHGDHLKHGKNIYNRLDEEPGIVNCYLKNEEISLPLPDLNDLTLNDALRLRRTRREYGVSGLSTSTLSTLLFKAAGVQGVFDTRPFQKTSLRPYPSGGARHPLNIYVVVRRVEKNLSTGCYYWNPLENSLIRLRDRLDRKDELHLFEDQLYYLDAPVWLLWSARLERRQFKYERAILYNILIELGAVLQNISLVGASLGLGGCPFEVRRKKFESYFSLDEEIEPFLLGYALGVPTDLIFMKEKANF